MTLREAELRGYFRLGQPRSERSQDDHPFAFAEFVDRYAQNRSLLEPEIVPGRQLPLEPTGSASVDLRYESAPHRLHVFDHFDADAESRGKLLQRGFGLKPAGQGLPGRDVAPVERISQRGTRIACSLSRT